MSKYFVFCVLVIQYFLVTNSKQFGYLDLFTCHCKDDRYCISDGTCTYGGCTTGWYGSTCQQQNIALMKPANQGSRQQLNGYGPELVVDGFRSQYYLQCMDTGFSNNRWWSVNLTDTYPIRQILIIYRNIDPNGYQSDDLYLYSLKGFKVDVTQDNGDSVLCYKQPDDTQPSSSHITVTCNNTIWGSGINISSTIVADKHFLVICEVEVYVCSNRTYGANCGKFCYCKDNVPCDYITGKCPTKECLPGFTGSTCNEMCIEGRYGLNCSQDCNERHCSGLQSCVFDTGKCVDGCLPGYNGTDCTQECPAGTYGYYCLQTCSINCLNKDCNHINGKCIGGCKPGFRSELCNEACDETKYGINCSRSCDDRNCYGSTECNHVSGNCTEGCLAGFIGVDCTEKCPNGFYGQDCLKICTDRNCLQNQNCDSLTGTCPDGCEPGFILTDCTQECNDGLYGVNCSKNCSERNCVNNSTGCSKVDGSCNGECMDGYTDKDCSIISRHAPTNGQDELILIASTVSGCVLAIIITIIIIVVIWRRNVPKKPKILSKAGNNNQGVYENVGDLLKEDSANVAVVKPQQAEKTKQEHDTSKVEEEVIDEVQNIVLAVNVESGSIHSVDEGASTREQHTIVDHPNQAPTESPKATPLAPKSAAPPKPASRPFLSDSTPTPVATKPATRQKPLKHTPKADNNEEQNKSLEAEKYYANEDDYYNLPSQTKFTVAELENFISDAKSQNGFKGLFAKLPTELVFPYTTSQLEPNKIKNRFNGYYPYDHSRVVLENSPDNPHLDYINANYLDGYSHNRKYIASQGPTTHMINDFVRMIMEKKCDKVIMVTKDYEMGKMKCLIYWPDDKPITKGDITLTLKKQKIRANYTIRTILMTKGDSSHTFTQLHYETWPDHDVPDVIDMLDFLYEVNKHRPESTAPQVVHCSAGVGRTGTYIAVDYCLDQYKATGSVDIMPCIKKLRNQRKGMVQTFGQLQFIFEALLEGIKRGDTCLYSNVFLNEYDSKIKVNSTALSEQFKHLKSIEMESEKSNQLHVTDEILIFRFPSHTLVDGYYFQELKDMKSAHIWQHIIYDRHIPSAVFIIDNTNAVSLCPETGTEEVYGETVVQNLSENDNKHSSIINVMVKSDTDETSEPVTVYILDITDPNINFNTLVQTLLELIVEVDIKHNDFTPMALFTSDARYGRTFCLLRNILQRIRLDNEVEIFRAVKSVHQKLGSTVSSLDGYKMLHKLVYDYLKSTETYANL